jgi:O-antigen ligase
MSAGSLRRTIFPLIVISAVVATVLSLAEAWQQSWVVILTVCAAILLFALLYLTWCRTEGRNSDPRRAFLMLALVIWWTLLISEQIFLRSQAAEEVTEVRFSSLAYGEGVFWAICFLASLLVSVKRPQYVHQMFAGPWKWMSLFALFCLCSSAYSPIPTYSLAWSFKLLLGVLLLRMCSSAIFDLNDLRAFFQTTLCAVTFLTFLPVARAFADPSTAFEGGRLNEAAAGPVGLSTVAGSLLLLSLTLNSLRRRGWLVAVSILAAGVMLLTGGKAGILAGIVSAMLFFLLQRKFAAGLGMLAGISLIGCAILLFTPLSLYMRSYIDTGELSTLTGRTALWAMALPEILQAPIFGHGYAASRVIYASAWPGHPEAQHLHNGFLEVLYNNGLLGLLLVLAMHITIVWNLGRVIRKAATREAHLFAVGSLALYLNILISGLANSSFGGRATTTFMLFLALVMIADTLSRLSQQVRAGPPAETTLEQPFSGV